MVGGQREDRRDERRLEVTNPPLEILQERLVPDTPGPVVIRFVIIGLPAVLLLESGVVGKPGQTERLTGGAMEESGRIAFFAQFASQAAHVVLGIGRQEERLDQRRQAAHHRRQGLDADAAVGEGIPEDQRFAAQRVQEGHVRGLRKALQFRQEAAVGGGETLQDQDDDVLGTEGRGIRRDMDRVENGLCLGLRLKVMRVLERIVSQGPVHAESGIEHNPRLQRTIRVQVGVVQGDRPDRHAESAPHSPDDRVDDRHKDSQVHGIVFPVPSALVKARPAIQENQCGQDAQSEQDQVPMGDKFMQEDAAEVVPAELAENRKGRAAVGERKINRVRQVGGKSDEVRHDIQAFDQSLPAATPAEPERQQRQDHVQRVGVHQGGNVKTKATLHQAAEDGPADLREQFPVLRKEHQPADRI